MACVRRHIDRRAQSKVARVLRSDTPKQFQANHAGKSGPRRRASFLRHFFLRDRPRRRRLTSRRLSQRGALAIRSRPRGRRAGGTTNSRPIAARLLITVLSGSASAVLLAFRQALPQAGWVRPFGRDRLRRQTAPFPPGGDAAQRAVQSVSRRGWGRELEGGHAGARTPRDTSPGAASSTTAGPRFAASARSLRRPP